MDYQKTRSERKVGDGTSSGVIDKEGRNTGAHELQIKGECLLLHHKPKDKDVCLYKISSSYVENLILHPP